MLPVIQSSGSLRPCSLFKNISSWICLVSLYCLSAAEPNGYTTESQQVFWCCVSSVCVSVFVLLGLDCYTIQQWFRQSYQLLQGEVSGCYPAVMSRITLSSVQMSCLSVCKQMDINISKCIYYSCSSSSCASATLFFCG